jgi:glycosyltransferase involved in cell wall biosynthesis
MTAPVWPQLTVAIDARARLGEDGGVDQVLVGLLSGISHLDDGDERYILLGYQESSEWLGDFVAAHCRFEAVSEQPPPVRPAMIQPLIRFVLKSPRAPKVPGLRPPPPPISDGTVERIGADVVHFPKQRAFVTRVPSIYLPHDLQHRHHPEFFSARDIYQRERWYATFCRQAALVTVMTQATRKDVAKAYGVNPDKIAVITWPPSFAGTPRLVAAEVARLRAEMSLPPRFAFFPAQTWPHKNHSTLFRAIAILREDGIEVPVVLSGHQTPDARSLRRLAVKLQIDGQVRWLGYVDSKQVEVAYRSATCVVYPSRFEGWGMPVLEALYFCVPLICSKIDHIPGLVGDAALLVNPDDPHELATAIRSIWCDEATANRLSSAALARSWGRDWNEVARDFRAQYRYVAGARLQADDVDRLRRQGLPLGDCFSS